MNKLNNIPTLIQGASTLLFILMLFTQCDSPAKKNVMQKDNKSEMCCNEDGAKSETSEITCPKCGHKKVETLPNDYCVIKYNCEKCNAELSPRNGDCCVFCTHGSHKCPSMQE